MEDFEKELKLDFLEEATQLLENTEQAFLQLENDLHNKDLIDEIFRFAHNLKGTSRAVGFGVVAEFTHEVENLILKIKQDEVEINAAVVSVLLECNDFIADMIQVLKDDFDATFDSVDLVAKVKEAVVGEMVDVEEYIPAAVESVPHQEEESDFDDMPSASSFDEDEAAMRHLEDAVQFEENPVIPESKPAQLAPGGVEFEENPVMPESKPAQLAPGGVEFEENPVMPESRPVEPAPAENLPGMNVFQGNENITQLAPAQEAKPKPKAKPNLKDDKKTEKDESIRVSLSRVEKLNNFVGELVILQSVLEQQKYKAITDELALKSISQLNKLSKEIQDISMSLRMVPVKTTLQKMSRIVRDTSKALDKKVNLTLIGEETEIDKTVLELIADPLVHIVRNACDHGLEDTADRPSVGKPE
ncbi:MAG: Hpt domain-containing protein, partial [Flavobacteriaceae bacterium]|nr:Hpt domain-containing protein [Flavobacteriaceae bacterium]